MSIQLHNMSNDFCTACRDVNTCYSHRWDFRAVIWQKRHSPTRKGRLACSLVLQSVPENSPKKFRIDFKIPNQSSRHFIMKITNKSKGEQKFHDIPTKTLESTPWESLSTFFSTGLLSLIFSKTTSQRVSLRRGFAHWFAKNCDFLFNFIEFIRSENFTTIWKFV